MRTGNKDVDRIIECFMARKFLVGSEAELQEALETALKADGVPYEREVILSETERPDFVCGRTAVEVKIKGTPAQVVRQLYRYAGLQEIDQVLLVTTSARLSSMPAVLQEKPVWSLWLRPF